MSKISMEDLQLCQDWLEREARVETQAFGDEFYDVYVSKEDGGYLTHVGMEDHVLFLAKRNLTHPQRRSEMGRTCSVGFDAQKKEWYGWSHRAIYGFGVGSKVKKGDCAYVPKDAEDFLDDMVRFWSDADHLNVHGEHVVEDGRRGVRVSWLRSNRIPNKKLCNTVTGIFAAYPDAYGKGAWTAQTLEDAKQMARDFAEGVD
jgi:hypothetical protein